MRTFYQQNRAISEEHRQNLTKRLASLFHSESCYDPADANLQKFYLEFKNQITRFIAETNEIAYQEIQHSDNSHLLLLKLTAMIDVVIQATLQTAVWLYDKKNQKKLEARDVPLAIVACGGYGREEIYFASDVDIRIISRGLAQDEPGNLIAEVGKYFEYLLVHQDIFRSKCKLGFTETKVKEGKLGADRMASFYSLMEHRLVAGDAEVYREFSASIKAAVARHQHEIVEYCLARKTCYEVQNTVFQQEPNIKEEMRRLYWALCLTRIKYALEPINLFELLDELYSQGKLSVPAFKNMQKALNFLARVRLFLHSCQKGYQRDLLSFEVRDRILESMGFPLKQFFQEYFYNAVYPLKRYSRNLFLECITSDTKIAKVLSNGFAINTENQIIFDRNPEDIFTTRPEMAFKIFVWVAEEGCHLSYPIIRAIENNINDLYPIFMAEKAGETYGCFQSVMEGKYFAKALRLMHEFGLLANYFIPEFKNLIGLLQDIYVHQFPTDIHILSALDELNKLIVDHDADPFLSQLYGSVKDKTALKLSVLLHDIGKGLKKPGEDEELIGSRQIPHILKNLGYNDDCKTADVAFLVEKHLTMRDLMLLDPEEDDTYEMIWDLVSQDKERLKMLILLTYADRGGTKMKMSASQIEQLKLFHQNTLHHKKHSSVPNAIKLEFLEMIRLPRDLQQQLDIYNEFIDSAEGFVAEMLLKPGQASELVVCARDYKGLLFHIAAVLVLNRLNIVEANIHTLGDKVFDVFKVLSSARKPIELGEYYFIQKQIKEDLRRIFIKKASLAEIYQGRTLPDRPEAGKYKEVKLRHKIIGRAIKLESHDILGTFMMTTKVFSELGLEIQRAVLHTHQGTASNVFYFNPGDMEQILEKKEKFIEKIQGALGKLLKAEPIFLEEKTAIV